MYKDFKIALSGPQSSGKSTLAYAWSIKHNVNLGKGTKDIMDIFSFKDHKQIIKTAVLTPEVGLEFQKTLAIEKLKEFKQAKKGLISDRSLIDIFTYYSIHNSMFANEETNEQMKNLLMEFFHEIDLLVFVSPRLSKIEDNKIRVKNSIYYETVSSVMYTTLASCISSLNTIGEDLVCDSFRIKESKIKSHLWHSQKKAFLHLDESECDNGIASVNQRIEAIEMALDDLISSR